MGRGVRRERDKIIQEKRMTGKGLGFLGGKMKEGWLRVNEGCLITPESKT